LEAKFKVGDRVVVSRDCDFEFSGRNPVLFRGRAGVVAGVQLYDLAESDYDVIIDGDEETCVRSCPAFEESHLSLEAV
jgi:ribosomal protein L21E